MFNWRKIPIKQKKEKADAHSFLSNWPHYLS